MMNYLYLTHPDFPFQLNLDYHYHYPHWSHSHPKTQELGSWERKQSSGLLIIFEVAFLLLLAHVGPIS